MKRLIVLLFVTLFVTGCITPSNYQVRNNNIPIRAAEVLTSQEVASQIEKEKPLYSKEYLLESVGVMGKCDMFINTPKYLIHSSAAEARTA